MIKPEKPLARLAQKTERTALFTIVKTWKQPKNLSKDERINNILYTVKYPSILRKKKSCLCKKYR